jgi:hypothetical protein
MSLARGYEELQNCLLLRGDFESALKWSGRAITILRSLVTRDPRDVNGRKQLWNIMALRAETLTRLGRHIEALTEYQEIAELTYGSKEGELFRAFHAVTKARLGDLSALASLGDEVHVVLRLGVNPESCTVYQYYMTYYDAACLHGALAMLALESREGPSSQRERVVQQHLERALDILEKSLAIGELKVTIPLDEVGQELLLDPLRSYPRFQFLMMDLAYSDDPFDAKAAPKPGAGNRTSPTSQPRENSGSPPQQSPFLEEVNMSRLLVMRHRPGAAVAVASLVLSLPLTGCGHPAEGTVHIDPSARRLGTDPVTKERADAKKYKQTDLAPVEPGKLPPGRGRASR